MLSAMISVVSNIPKSNELLAPNKTTIDTSLSTIPVIAY